MVVCLPRKPYSTLFPLISSPFSFLTKHRYDNNHAMDQTDESDLPSISEPKLDTHTSLSTKKSLGSHGKRKTILDLRDDLNKRSNEVEKDIAIIDSKNDHYDTSLPVSFGKKKLAYPNRKAEQNSAVGGLQKEPFSLIRPISRNSVRKTGGDERIEMENNLENSCQVLRSGMILLKNYVSLGDQVEIVNICQNLGTGPGGFYQPGYRDGAKLRLQMMCLGRNWDPQTKYDQRFRNDGSEAPPIPDKLVSLVEEALRRSRELVNSVDELPMMSPDICIINFYTIIGRLGLHQDRDESSYSLERGLPVVSISIGDSAEFLYSDKRDVDNAEKVLLESGDVLIFGGESRHIFHGVKTIIPNSAPLPLLQEAMLRPGRLNLTFRQF